MTMSPRSRTVDLTLRSLAVAFGGPLAPVAVHENKRLQRMKRMCPKVTGNGPDWHVLHLEDPGRVGLFHRLHKESTGKGVPTWETVKTSGGFSPWFRRFFNCGWCTLWVAGVKSRVPSLAPVDPRNCGRFVPVFPEQCGWVAGFASSDGFPLR